MPAEFVFGRKSEKAVAVFGEGCTIYLSLTLRGKLNFRIVLGERTLQVILPAQTLLDELTALLAGDPEQLR